LGFEIHRLEQTMGCSGSGVTSTAGLGVGSALGMV
jgi:hypothetical protein